MNMVKWWGQAVGEIILTCKLKAEKCCYYSLVLMPRNPPPRNSGGPCPCCLKGEPLHFRRIWWSHSISGASKLLPWCCSPVKWHERWCHAIRWIYIILIDVSITYSLGLCTMISIYYGYMQGLSIKPSCNHSCVWCDHFWGISNAQKLFVGWDFWRSSPKMTLENDANKNTLNRPYDCLM